MFLWHWCYECCGEAYARYLSKSKMIGNLVTLVAGFSKMIDVSMGCGR